jgi:hypothetical protein
MNVAVAELQPGPVTYMPAAEITPMQMLQVAVAQGADLERIQKLMDLQDRWEAKQAREAYVTAVAGFKSEPAKIIKSKKVDIPGGAKFSHATLADVCDGVVANLSKYGLSHSYNLNQLENGWVEVTCIVTHKAGHSESTSLRAPPDDSGKKNSIQQIASTVSYLERYTLVAALGLAAKDMDDDGRGGPQQKPQEDAPQGYNNWRADMTALADDGLEALTASWGKSSGEFRRYVVKYDEAWWRDCKSKAGKVAK